MPIKPTQLGIEAAVFVAILAVGVLLIMSRSASAQDVSVLTPALGGLYAVWLNRSPARSSQVVLTPLSRA
ncbi:hypothetical protein [Streptomyces sp. NBC_00525]|uniref:hypothetical protein n=1 Tax=Streptomyces sp. NBC_00525 TaxID=2903660 RepID=UPI002E80E119|nr:hypothetical protein [Streptomyces sp. NBC_00525]WUC93684.1 hypothetical protein OG710_08750 [Streptomyces sp. NBC_00525]